MAVMCLGALCELESESPWQANFRISEYAVLDDGTEIVLHSDRGFSAMIQGSAGVWEHMTAASIEREVMTVVLPDDAEETGGDHPWEWLVTLLAHAGVTETVDHLREVPYGVPTPPAGSLRSLNRRRPSLPVVKRYRCTTCGNLTRFDVTTSRRERSFHHYTVGGELTIEDTQVLDETVDSVECRWCGPSGEVLEETVTASS